MRKIKGNFIEFFKPMLNTNVMGKFVKDYEKENIKECSEVYYIDNRKSLIERAKECYVKIKDKINEFGYINNRSLPF